MISKAQIKFITSLKLKKFRQINNKYIAEGIKIVEELINSSASIDSVFATNAWIKKHSETNFDFNITEISDIELLKISNLETPNEVLAVVNIPSFKIDYRSLENELILALDNIQDPGNIGTIVRIADWFGIKNIICSDNCVDIYNSKAVQSTMGSIARVKCCYANLAEILGSFSKQTGIYGAVLNSESIYEKDLSGNGIIIIGNESKGISQEISKFINQPISIPYYPISSDNQRAESLNASVAAGIICSEFRRRLL